MITTLPPISILPQALASLGEASSAVSSLNLQEETREFLLKTLIGGRLGAPLLGIREDRLEAQTLAVRALRGRLTPGTVADRLWIRLAEDYGRRIPGAEVFRVQQDRCVVIRCSKKSYQAHLRLIPGSYDLLPSLRLIQGQLKGHLSLLREEEEAWVMAFPVPTVFEQVLRLAHGVDAPRFVYVWGEIPRDTVNEHHKTNQRPIGIVLDEIFLADAKRKVHPFIFSYHDIYHAAMAAALPRSLRHLWARLYDLVGRFPFSPADKGLREDLLDALTNHDIERRPETPVMTLALVPFRPVTDRIVEGFQSGDWDEGLDRLEAGAGFLENFLTLLRKTPLLLTDPEEISWKDRLERDLNRLLEDLNPQIVVRRALMKYGV